MTAWSAEGVYLALDTSTSVGSVCVGRGSRVVAESVILGQGSHSADLIPSIGGVLEEAGVDLSELSGLVVGAGPGSFTGVRVAAATVKGLAHVLDIPLWGVSSLEAGAAAVGAAAVASAAVDIPTSDVPTVDLPALDTAAADASAAALDAVAEDELSHPRYVLFDARGDRVYGACYRPTGGGLDVLIPPHSTTIGEVLSGDLAVCVFAGDGAQKHADEIRGAGFTVLPAPLGMPTAAGLLRVVAASPLGEPIEDVARWQPEYLRSSSAERLAKSGA